MGYRSTANKTEQVDNSRKMFRLNHVVKTEIMYITLKSIV